MNRRLEFRADVEQGPDGSSQIFIQPLLGCYSRAPNLREALRKAPSKIHEYAAWLNSHGEEIESEPIELKICETIRGDWPVNLGDSVALFNCDRQRLVGEEIDKYLRWMDYSWQDFQDLIERVPEVALDWKPTRDTFRSMRRIIEHVALCQVWYLTKLRMKGELPFRYPKGLSLWAYASKIERHHDISPDTLNGVRVAAVYRLKNLREVELEQVTYSRPGLWTGRTTSEEWTARKVFRRFLWHEKLHMHTMRKFLSIYEAGTNT